MRRFVLTCSHCAEEMEHARDFSSYVRRMAQHSSVLGSRGLSECTRLALSVAAVLRAQWTRTLQLARLQSRPTMMIYASDGWGCTLAQAHTVQLGPFKLQRSGRARAEFLLERGALKTIDSLNRITMNMRFCAPRLLSAGKSGWHIWAVAVDFHPYLKDEVGDAFAISWYVQDGLHVGGMRRRMLARHTLYHDACEEAADEPDGTLKREKDLTVTWKCTSHAVSNALKWGLAEVTSEQMLDDLAIGILSLINSSEEVLQAVDYFLFSRVVWEGDEGGTQEREELWRWLGVPDAMVPIVMEVDPVWMADKSMLRVSRKLAGTANGLEKVRSVMTYFMSWRRFSLTRWGGVVSSCRRLVCSLLIGVDYLCKQVFRDGNSYHLHGYKRINSDVRRLAVIGSIGMQALERFALELLEDDRLLLRASELSNKLKRDAAMTQAVPAHVWQPLAECIGEPGFSSHHLRDRTLRCMLTAMGYVHMHVFRQLQEHPFKLTQGDVGEKIDALLCGPPPEEMNANRIRTALLCGVSRTEVTRLLLLLRDAPCSTGMVEKGHSHAAVVHRQHRLYGPALLAARSLVLQTSPLFQAPRTNVRGPEARLRKRLATLKSKVVAYSPRHHFCKLLMSENASAEGPRDRKARMMRAVSMHSSMFDTLHPIEQEVLREEAASEKRRRVEANQREVERLSAEVRALEAEAKTAAASDVRKFGVRNVVDAVRFSSAEIAEVERLFMQTEPGGFFETRELGIEAPRQPEVGICDVVEAAGKLVTTKDAPPIKS